MLDSGEEKSPDTAHAAGDYYDNLERIETIFILAKSANKIGPFICGGHAYI